MKRFLLSYLLVATTAFAQQLPWTVETSPVFSTRAGDPTFVFAPTARRLIVGADSMQPGLFFWAPESVQTPRVDPLGLINAADSRGAILVATSLSTNSLLVYRVTDGGIALLDTGSFNVPSPGQVALSRLTDGGYEVWVDTSSQVIEHHAMIPGTNGIARFFPLPSITVPERPSGLAVDDRNGRLYVAQPSLGVITVERNGSSQFLLSIDAGRLGTTIGGIDLFLTADGGALVLTCAPTEVAINVHSHFGTQTNFLTALQFYDPDAGPGLLVTPRFLDVYEQPAPGFPRGVLLLQDDLTGNYKLVSLAGIDSVFPLPAPFLPAGSFDAGTPDAGGGSDGGTNDGGLTDGGVTDAGLTDGGVRDGGPTGGGPGGRPSGPGPGADPEPEPSCGCTGGPFAVLPALLMLWWIRRRSTRP